MKKLIVQEFVTLDAFAAAPDGGLDFMPQSQPGDWNSSVEENQWQFLDTVDTMILGRNTYEMFAAYWPTATERIAPKLNAMDKYVCSHTLTEAPWGSFSPATVISRNPEAEIMKLKTQPGKDLVIWGSLALVQSICSTDLIDEYQLVVCPFIIGKGKRLFPDEYKSSGLDLRETKTFDGGFVLLRYRVSR